MVNKNLLGDYVDRGALNGAAVKTSLAHKTKSHNAFFKCKKRVVFAKANMFARDHFGTALAYQYVAGLGNLASIEFNAQIFRLGVG